MVGTDSFYFLTSLNSGLVLKPIKTIWRS